MSLLVTPAQNRPARSRSSSISSVGSTSSFASSLRGAALTAGSAALAAAEATADAARGRAPATPDAVRRRASSSKAAQWERPEDRGGSLIAPGAGALASRSAATPRTGTPSRRPTSPGGVHVITSPKGVTVAEISMGGGYTPSMGSRTRRETSSSRQQAQQGSAAVAGSARPRSASAASATRAASRTAGVAPATPDFRQKVAASRRTSAAAVSATESDGGVATPAARRERPWRLGRPSTAFSSSTGGAANHEPTVEVYAPFLRPTGHSYTPAPAPSLVPVSAARDVLADISAVLDEIGGLGGAGAHALPIAGSAVTPGPKAMGLGTASSSSSTLLSGLAAARAMTASSTGRRRTAAAPPLGPYPAVPQQPSFGAIGSRANSPSQQQRGVASTPSPPRPAAHSELDAPAPAAASSVLHGTASFAPVAAPPPPPPPPGVPSNIHSEALRLRQTIRLRQLEEVLRGYYRDIAAARASEAAAGEGEGVSFGSGADGVGVATLLSAAESCLREVNVLRGGLGMSPLKAATALGPASPRRSAAEPMPAPHTPAPSSPPATTRGRSPSPSRTLSSPSSLLTDYPARARQEEAATRAASPAPARQAQPVDLAALSPWTAPDAGFAGQRSEEGEGLPLQWPSPPRRGTSPASPRHLGEASAAAAAAAANAEADAAAMEALSVLLAGETVLPSPPRHHSPPHGSPQRHPHHHHQQQQGAVIVLSAAPPSKVYNRTAAATASPPAAPPAWRAMQLPPPSPPPAPAPVAEAAATSSSNSSGIVAARGALARIARAAAAKAAAAASGVDTVVPEPTPVAKRAVPGAKPAIRFAVGGGGGGDGDAAAQQLSPRAPAASGSPSPSRARKAGSKSQRSPHAARANAKAGASSSSAAKAALASLLDHGTVVAEDRARLAAASAPPLAERAVLMEQEQQLHAMGTLGPWESTPPLLPQDASGAAATPGAELRRSFSTRDEARTVLAALPASLRTLLPIPDTITTQRLSQTLNLSATGAAKRTRGTSPQRSVSRVQASPPLAQRATMTVTPGPSSSDAHRVSYAAVTPSFSASAPASAYRGLDGSVWPSYVPASWTPGYVPSAATAGLGLASLQFARPPGDAPPRHVDTLADIARQRDADAAALRARSVAAAALMVLPPSLTSSAQATSSNGSASPFPALDRLAAEGRKRAAAAAAASGAST